MKLRRQKNYDNAKEYQQQLEELQQQIGDVCYCLKTMELDVKRSEGKHEYPKSEDTVYIVWPS